MTDLTSAMLAYFSASRLRAWLDMQGAAAAQECLGLHYALVRQEVGVVRHGGCVSLHLLQAFTDMTLDVSAGQVVKFVLEQVVKGVVLDEGAFAVPTGMALAYEWKLLDPLQDKAWPSSSKQPVIDGCVAPWSDTPMLDVGGVYPGLRERDGAPLEDADALRNWVSAAVDESIVKWEAQPSLLPSLTTAVRKKVGTPTEDRLDASNVCGFFETLFNSRRDFHTPFEAVVDALGRRLAPLGFSLLYYEIKGPMTTALSSKGDGHLYFSALCYLSESDSADNFLPLREVVTSWVGCWNATSQQLEMRLQLLLKGSDLQPNIVHSWELAPMNYSRANLWQHFRTKNWLSGVSIEVAPHGEALDRMVDSLLLELAH